MTGDEWTKVFSLRHVYLRRLSEKSVKHDQCILWTGGVNSIGHGIISVFNQSVSVHKLAFVCANGPINYRDQVRHTCRMCACVNPSHLFLVQCDKDRFWRSVVKSDDRGCWTWTGCVHDFGYGRISIGGSPIAAHRYSWILHFGEIPDGMQVLHKCDNPPCVRPDHLYLGVDQDNANDRVARGRTVRGENRPDSILTASDVVTIRRRYSSGGTSYARIAFDYGVSVACIVGAIKRRTWKHVP
jgi:hypothetical protein